MNKVNYLFTAYLNGTLAATLEQMETKDVMKSFKDHCFGNRPPADREKLITLYLHCMEKAMNKGKAFMK